jgi:hydroxyethylthiazole kinase
MLNKIAEVLQAVREKTPLVQAVTNYVTINDCANILLCFGASPAMVEVREEMEEFVPLISAFYINTGTLTREQEEASLAAVKIAAELDKPVVLDPVACGVLSRKMRFIERLLAHGKITVIKGNTGEIKALAGYAGKVRGVDSIDDGEGAAEACRLLAQKTGAVIVSTGKTDIVTDGARTCLIDNGTPLLTLITGAGCMAGALAAATAGAADDMFLAGAAAMTAMGLAGEMGPAGRKKFFPAPSGQSCLTPFTT